MVAILVLAYFVVLLLLCTYGAHRARLVYLCHRHREELTAAKGSPPLPEELPHVTVQLPLYNEATVVDRLLEAVALMDYPRDRLEIQVLDDSSDETRTLARRQVERMQAQGIDAVYVRRPDRHGYKAGALDYGLSRAKGSLIAVFDADFVPQPDFLNSLVGHFEDPEIGMVQARWGHMNRNHSLFTSVQALMLDGHHMVENRARFGSGCMFNFSGTGGMWRRQAIADAGGWEHDTLTEDLDLSYRAQLAGWRFLYREDVVSPAELPEDISAFRAQQFRWAKGTVQTARKLLRRVLSAPGLRFDQRVEALFHMTPHFAYPLIVMLTVLLLPALLMLPATDLRTMVIIDLPLVMGATGSIATFYAVAERAQGRSAWSAIRRLPAIIALGAGLAPHITKAVLSGLQHMSGEFVRTPKRGSEAGRYFQVAQLPLIEIGLMLVSSASVVASVVTEHWFATPFAALFALGYAYVAATVTKEQLANRRAAVERASVPDAAAEPAAEPEVARAA